MIRPLALLALAGTLSLAHAEASAKEASFFTVQKVEGKWWLIDTQGEPVISQGVTSITMNQDIATGTNRFPYAEAVQSKYGSDTAWRQAAARRLIGWNFNTAGPWSDDAIADVEVDGKTLYSTPTITIGRTFIKNAQNSEAVSKNNFPDVFDPGFPAAARQTALERCAPFRDKKAIIGWFTDNELRWGPDWRGPDELLVLFLNLPQGAPGRDAAWDFLRRKYADIGKFNAVWSTSFASWQEAAAAAIRTPAVASRKQVYGQNLQVDRTASNAQALAFLDDCDGFAGLAAEKYFAAVCDAVRAADSHHLVLGCRFAIIPPAPAIAAAARHVDVISFNCYDPNGPSHPLDVYSAFGKPLLIGEFSFRGKDSGLPNSTGAGPRVETQAERGARFEAYVRAAVGNPNLIGYHWFEHADEPKEGRPDGEDNNYGLVDIRDTPYAAMAEKVTEVNSQAGAWHRDTLPAPAVAATPGH